MQLRDAINKISEEYLKAKDQPFASHPLGMLFRQSVPILINDRITIPDNNWHIKASVGEGRWSEVPWIGIFDPIITTSAMKGYYSPSSFYSSLVIACTSNNTLR